MGSRGTRIQLPTVQEDSQVAPRGHIQVSVAIDVDR